MAKRRSLLHDAWGILGVVEIQLRDYRIKPGHMDDWIAGWERPLGEDGQTRAVKGNLLTLLKE